MSLLDYAAIGVILVSMVWGIWRGLMREVMSLAGWVLAFLAANAVAAPIGELLPASLASAEVRILIAFAAIFVLVLSAATLAGMALSKLFKAAGLSGVDRTLGAIFGLARGIVILLAFTIAAGLTSLPRHPLWKESVAAGMATRTILQLTAWMPPALEKRLKYN